MNIRARKSFAATARLARTEAQAIASEGPLDYADNLTGFRMNMTFELFSVAVAASFVLGSLGLLA